MGTVLQVTIVADDEPESRRLADAAIDVARHWDDVLTTWRPEGELARLNARAGTGPVEISADLALALLRMRELSAATGGAFDPAIGALVRRWRDSEAPFLGLTGSRAHGRAAPSIAEVLKVGGHSAALAAGAELDAGGVGKGVALDAIAAMLRAAGIRAAFLDFGGSSQLAIGAPAESPEGWPVVVAGLERGAVHGIVHLRDGALSTSRSSGPGAAEGPIVDPRSGTPVIERRLATVLAADATTCEAWSTALVVRGRPGVPAARDAGLDVFYEDANGRSAAGGLKPIRRKEKSNHEDHEGHEE